MSAWWLLLIVPLSAAAGAVLSAMLFASSEADRRSEEMAEVLKRKAAEPVTLRARRDIPLDVWMDRIEQTDAKTVAAQLQVSMAQQIATEAAQYVQVTYCYDPVKKVYEISARMRVVPWREWE